MRNWLRVRQQMALVDLLAAEREAIPGIAWTGPQWDLITAAESYMRRGRKKP